MTRLETKIVVPRSPSPRKDSQRASRSRGSSPTVGSSSTSTSGSPSSAVPSDTRALAARQAAHRPVGVLGELHRLEGLVDPARPALRLELPQVALHLDC